LYENQTCIFPGLKTGLIKSLSLGFVLNRTCNFPVLIDRAAGRRNDGEDSQGEQDDDREYDLEVDPLLRDPIGDDVVEVLPAGRRRSRRVAAKVIVLKNKN
jgi:hypothetical protein